MSELGEFVSLNWMKRGQILRRENFRLFFDDSKTMTSRPIRLRNIAKSQQRQSRKSKLESRLPAMGLGRYPT
jgi:hypothetical protein